MIVAPLVVAIVAAAARDGQLVDDYVAFLNDAPTAARAVRHLVARAPKFRAVELGSPLAWRPGDSIAVQIHGQAVMFARAGRRPASDGLRVIASHIDAVGFRADLRTLRGNKVATLDGFEYGGTKPYQWSGRPLRLVGTLQSTRGKVDVDLEPFFEYRWGAEAVPPPDGKRRKGRDGTPRAKKSTGAAVLRVVVSSTGWRPFLARLGVETTDLAGMSLSFQSAERARRVGVGGKLLAAPGQDDRFCAYAAFRALVDDAHAAIPEFTTAVLFVDREEEGSRSRAGALSEAVDTAFQMIAGRAHLRDVYARTIVWSADVKSGVNPLFPSVQARGNAARLGSGPTFVKFTGGPGKRRAHEAHAEVYAHALRVAARAGIPYQVSQSGRVEEGGGGTVANDLAHRGMLVVDVGLPVLSMHSPLEISHVDDLAAGVKLFRAFLADAEEFAR